MKGIIFTTLIELVEDVFGLDVMDRVIEKADPPSGGAYTAVGTYPHSEIIALVIALSEETQIPVPQLLHTYGKHLYGILASNYPEIIIQYKTSFDLLEHIEDHIHTEVRKLYPDADLPMFHIEHRSEDKLTLRYESERAMSDVAHGLMESCFDEYKTKVDIEKTLLTEDGKEARFNIKKSEKS